MFISKFIFFAFSFKINNKKTRTIFSVLEMHFYLAETYDFVKHVMHKFRLKAVPWRLTRIYYSICVLMLIQAYVEEVT